MREHLYPHEIARRAADAVPLNGFVYVLDLVEVELARQHHHIGELGVEAQRLDIGDGELGGDVHLKPYAAAIHYRSHIRCDDGVHPGSRGCIEGLPHRGKVFLIEDYVERKVALHPRLAADAHHFSEVVRAEVVGRMAAHIELPDTEIHGVRSALYGRAQALEIARRSHYFQFFTIQFLSD